MEETDIKLGDEFVCVHIAERDAEVFTKGHIYKIAEITLGIDDYPFYLVADNEEFLCFSLDELLDYTKRPEPNVSFMPLSYFPEKVQVIAKLKGRVPL